MNNLFKDYPNKTILIYKRDKIIYTSEYKGVRPMMEFMKVYGPSDEPLTVVDRIMGRGAVMLAVLINGKKIITPVISETALELAKHHNLEVEYMKTVPYIINREKNGRCPIETALLDIEDVQEGYEAIKKQLAALMAQSSESLN